METPQPAPYKPHSKICGIVTARIDAYVSVC